MALQVSRKQRWEIRVQRCCQTRGCPTCADNDAIIGVGELYRVDEVSADGRSDLANDRLVRLRPTAFQLWESIITPIAGIRSGVRPRVLGVAESQHMVLRQVVIAANILLTIVQVCTWERLPVIAAAGASGWSALPR